MYRVTIISQYFKLVFLVGMSGQKRAWSEYNLTLTTRVKMDGCIVFLGQKYLGFDVQDYYNQSIFQTCIFWWACLAKKWAWSVYKLTLISRIKMDGCIVFLGPKYLGFDVYDDYIQSIFQIYILWWMRLAKKMGVAFSGCSTP